MGVDSFTLQPLFPLVKEPQIPIRYEAGWAGGGLDSVERKIICLCQESNPAHPARRYTD